MKKIYQCFIIIFMLIIYLNVNAQPVKIGANVMLGLPNSITQTGYGIGGIFEIKITDKFSGRLSVGTHLAYFEKEGLRGNELTQNKYCGLIIYRPYNNKIGSYLSKNKTKNQFVKPMDVKKKAIFDMEE